MIRKTVCNGIMFTAEKNSPRAGSKLRTSRSVGQCLTHSATGAPRSETERTLKRKLKACIETKQGKGGFIYQHINRALNREY